MSYHQCEIMSVYCEKWEGKCFLEECIYDKQGKKFLCAHCKKGTDNVTYSHEYMEPEFVEKYGDKTNSTCDACRDRLNRETDYENEQYKEDVIVCPACGYIHHDSWEVGDNEDRWTCPSCDETVDIEIRIERTFTTKRIVPKSGVPEDWKEGY